MAKAYLDIKLTAAQSREARQAIYWYRTWAGMGVRIPKYAERGVTVLVKALIDAEHARNVGGDA